MISLETTLVRSSELVTQPINVKELAHLMLNSLCAPVKNYIKGHAQLRCRVVPIPFLLALPAHQVLEILLHTHPVHIGRLEAANLSARSAKEHVAPAQ